MIAARKPAVLFLAVLSVAVAACAPATPNGNRERAGEASLNRQNINYDELRVKIASGRAELAEVRQALTDSDIGRLTNTLHALYSMRWHRGVTTLLQRMWSLRKENYPELHWDAIDEAPARIALASTLSRIYYDDNREYLEYIRAHGDDEHEFHRAQVVIALGFNGSPDDVKYIRSMADGNNHYVAQSAITALSIMDRKAASDAMIELWRKHRGTPRGDLILELLGQAYNLYPTMEKPAQ